jgi:hypothetical protein
MTRNKIGKKIALPREKRPTDFALFLEGCQKTKTSWAKNCRPIYLFILFLMAFLSVSQQAE